MSGATFAFAGVRILVHDTDAAHVAWLDEFLAPAFERVDGGHADWRVAMLEDEARYRAAVARGPAGGALPAFSFDARVDPLPRWRSEADVALLDESRGVLIEAWPRARAVRVLARPGAGRVPLMRVVREIGANHAQRRGGLLLHAAAVAVGDRGLVVSGPKHAGKTSLLLHLLRARGARYVSNDRVLVPEPGATSGVPTKGDALDLAERPVRHARSIARRSGTPDARVTTAARGVHDGQQGGGAMRDRDTRSRSAGLRHREAPSASAATRDRDAHAADVTARATAVGVPTLVALRRGTLDLFPALAARLASSHYASRLTIAEARVGAPNPSPSPSVSPAQLWDLAGVAASACTGIAAVVLPRVTNEPGTYAVRRLTDDEVAAAIPDLLFGVHGGAATSTVLVVPDGPATPGAEALTRAARRLAARVPCVECRLGLDAFVSADAADDMVAALLRA